MPYSFSFSSTYFIKSPDKLENYKLTSFIYHSGGIQGGHYITFVLYNDIWYEADDSEVTIVDDNNIQQFLHQSYVYVYRKT